MSHCDDVYVCSSVKRNSNNFLFHVSFMSLKLQPTLEHRYIHDCSVINQDDCFDVKDGTSSVVIEAVSKSGLGLTIGSISSHVNNITFRDSRMDKTYKGIYVKFRGEVASRTCCTRTL